MQTSPSYRNPTIFSANPQAAQPAQPSAMQQLCFRGEVRDAVSRYGLQLNWEGSHAAAKITGRFGGWWLGERLQLEWNGQELLGLIWSGQVRYALSARFQPSHAAGASTAEAGRLELRLVGGSEVYRASLDLADGRASGTASTVRGDFSLDLALKAGVLQGVSNGRSAKVHQRQHLCLASSSKSTAASSSNSDSTAPMAVLVTLAVLADALNREISQVALESLRLMGEA
jgi:hypothetical protein